MKTAKNTLNRRSLLKSSALAGGGMLLSFSWLAKAQAADKTAALNSPESWAELTGYIRITPDNVVRLMCSNPEFGPNVMTSLPMILAEELDAERGLFETHTFNELVAIVGNSTWEVMNARKKLKVSWEPMADFKEVINMRGNMADKAVFVGPLQAPGFAEETLATRFGVPKDKIEIQMTRMGGGFGRRAYPHYMVEAGLISQKVKAPVKLVYTREDDMTYGMYRPMYTATYRAALDADKNLIGFHVNGYGPRRKPGSCQPLPGGGRSQLFSRGLGDSVEHHNWGFPRPALQLQRGRRAVVFGRISQVDGQRPVRPPARSAETGQRKPRRQNQRL